MMSNLGFSVKGGYLTQKSLRTLSSSEERERTVAASSDSFRRENKEISTEEKKRAVFEGICAKLRARVGKDAYSCWFGRLKLDEYMHNQVRLSVPTPFLRSWINNHYAPLLLNLWKEENASILRIEIVVRGVSRRGKLDVSRSPDKHNEGFEDSLQEDSETRILKTKNETLSLVPCSFKQEVNVPSLSSSTFGSPLDPRYVFENFVEGASNRVALAAAKSITESATKPLHFNPLFIYASVGLGKTHLLQAIATSALRRNPLSRVVYLTAEYFMWSFATAIRDNVALSFKERMRKIDLLIIDDMQFLQGKSIQHEFCHLLNTLLDSAKQVVVAADRPPAELGSLDLRVRSRLQGGISLEIGIPDYETRLAMLRYRLKIVNRKEKGLIIAENVLSHIAQIVSGSGRDVEGALNQLLFRQSLDPNLSIDRIDKLLQYLTRNETRKVMIEDIQRIVAQYYNVTKQDMLSSRRSRVIVKPRQVAMYLAKTMTARSFPEIGRRFGGRDHTTVLHAVRRIEEMIGEDRKIAQEIELLKRLVGENTELRSKDGT